jgi:signal peptidase I
MSEANIEKSSSKKTDREHRDRAAEIANTLEWLVTAFMLAFVFRAFVMEAFRIPTGSMADTLKGDHIRLRCPQCGYQYDYGMGNFRSPQNRSIESRCPSCGWHHPTGADMSIANGDRILVLKCIYQFFEPKRWDVVVFKNPLDPSENYIKRLIGLPGETLDIIDGDIYISGQIARKPPKVQGELWMPVYDNDYQPVRPRKRAFNNRQSWRQPFKNGSGSEWVVPEDKPTEFHLDGASGQASTMTYDASIGNELTATYAYGDILEYANRPYCSDLMVRFYVRCSDAKGSVGAGLSKYGTMYTAKVDLGGDAVDMIIEKTERGAETVELERQRVKPAAVNKPTLLRFANVDHQLIFEFGSSKLRHDLGRGPEDAGAAGTHGIEPEVQIFGAGQLALSHVAIFRDIHYTAKEPRTGEPFKFELEEDEFFVLGDNSPNSKDSRWWDEEGIGIDGESAYRTGIVPRDYLIGKALFVYWPSGFKFPWPRGIRSMPIISWIATLKWVPNVGQMRLIYGGSGRNAEALANPQPEG